MNNSKNRERRFRDFGIELRGEGEGEKRTISGYAAKFNKESELLYGSFVEVIEPGAFDDVLQDDVRALLNHDNNFILARTKSGTLNLSVDEIGLRYEFTAPDTTAGNDLLQSIKRGDISQSSFGFTIASGGAEWEIIENEDNSVKEIRRIKKIKRLYDVSPVTFPAYPDTEVAVRSYQEWKKESSQGEEKTTDTFMLEAFKRKFKRLTGTDVKVIV